MTETLKICDLNQIEDPGSRGFQLSHEGKTTDGFVVLRDGQAFAYRNSCPHLGSPLDWIEHQFLDGDNVYIQCAGHDALFEIDTGVCITAPCPGEALQSLNTEIKDNAIYWLPDTKP